MYAQELRERVCDGELLLAPGVFDALSASIVESIGFEAVYLGGYATGAATAHTEPILTMTEMCDRAREITHNVEIPLIVDGDAGFGDAAHTYRAINEYAKAGIAGIHIEDQVYPKRLHYHAGIKRTISTDEMVGKIEAAVESREDHDEDIVIIARTDTARDQRREYETIEDAVSRINTYLSAGADAGLLFPSSTEELQYATEHVDGPVVFVMVEGREPNLTADELDEAGISVTLNALSATVAVTRAVHQLYTNLYQEGHTHLNAEEFNQYQEQIEELIGLPKYYEIEERTDKK